MGALFFAIHLPRGFRIHSGSGRSKTKGSSKRSIRNFSISNLFRGPPKLINRILFFRLSSFKN
ncbi:hypothetical protein LIH_17885 [Leptospira interrogans serovar Hardjo-prajitno]|nr:hypothetical protein BRAT_18535 [Leptospira interrogans serovar Bratislava]ALO02211.1 hypothetical protein LIH_17885 [Leptospira interrogans serovar Hardjo-prajitno]KGE21504.1 hypothetical protein IQ65_23315 [Leptospira interrogans serovar Lai]KYZ63718.1 hypothetical protein AWU66_18450 [Leptospira interrogans serovar Pomona]MCR8626972.1 hypothetical protein [Leptospira interrogans serovar Canicola]MCR8638050.1 hypothetical protein [Leptospira interrogans serovar Ricardi]MCR8648066.1 hypot